MKLKIEKTTDRSHVKTMLKLYTSCINRFLQDHFEISKIITTEQAGCKKDIRGGLEQLMINKTILDEVIKHKRSVVMVWLDYQKAFNIVPHEWLLPHGWLPQN